MINDCVIIVHGNVAANTNEIIKRYSSLNYPVIFSTYTYENTTGINAHIIKNDPPPIMGAAHHNGVMITVNKGLKEAQSMGFSFALKNRSDHLFKKPDFLQIMNNYLQQYPVEVDNQSYRIIVGDAGTSLEEMWGKFHISDFWLFGAISDLLKYFDVNNGIWRSDVFKSLPLIPSVEPALCQMWLHNIGAKYNDFESLLADRFIVLDDSDLDYVIAKELFDIMNITTNWEAKTDPKTVHHYQWKELYAKNHI
jgi:hypothetical protein